jgi:excisionase family DNA binding protein
MTMPALAEGLGSRLPSADEKAIANQLRQIIAAHAAGDAKLFALDEEKKQTEVTLTPALSDLLVKMLRHIGSGDAVTLVPVSQMLTTQQAADILNVSRPFLIGLLERREIEHTMVGRHRRIRAEDLFAYRERRAIARDKALSDLAALDAEVL